MNETTPAGLVPGATVRHRHKRDEHDEWRGVLVSIVTTEAMYGNSREYMVRWIKPCGDPSDGLSRCAADELEVCC